jgi:hypothetical protein
MTEIKLYIKDQLVTDVTKTTLSTEGAWMMTFVQHVNNEYRTYYYKVVGVSMISGGKPETLIIDLEPKPELRIQPRTVPAKV